MQDYLYQVQKYLPVDFEDQLNVDFIRYHESAYLENIDTKKFQFAYKTFHMLYMVFIYKANWIINKTTHPGILSDKKEYKIKLKTNQAPVIDTAVVMVNEFFHQSQLHEVTSIKDVISSLGGFDGNDIDKCTNHVTVRNHCSHCSGKIEYDEKGIDNAIYEELKYIERIQSKLKSQVKTIFINYINVTYNTKWLESDIKEWVIKNYFSQRDVEEIILYKPEFLKLDSNNKEVVQKKILYAVLINEMAKYLEERGDYFIKSLTSLMKGLVSKIDIREFVQDKKRYKSTQEMIEESIVPILINLPNQEALKAQQILKLNTA